MHRSHSSSSLPFVLRVLMRSPGWVQRGIVKPVDRLYLSLQVAFKSMGLVQRYEIAPEAVDDGARFAWWDARPPLPFRSLRVPLPPDAALELTVESAASRGAMWKTAKTAEAAADFFRDALTNNGWEVAAPPRHGVLQMRQRRSGGEVTVASSPTGGSLISITQTLAA